jgi:hypothetical protein
MEQINDPMIYYDEITFCIAYCQLCYICISEISKWSRRTKFVYIGIQDTSTGVLTYEISDRHYALADKIKKLLSMSWFWTRQFIVNIV